MAVAIHKMHMAHTLLVFFVVIKFTLIVLNETVRQLSYCISAVCFALV